jgi:hypothetical protein
LDPLRVAPIVDAMPARTHDTVGVVETRVVHDAQRHATSLFVDATRGRSAPMEALDAFRDFLVATLRHHHESEDRDLWVLLTNAAPSLREPLAALTVEHARLEEALDRLARDASLECAAELRDLVHEHLGHEEPVLFPALRTELSDEEWAGFSARTVASSPPEHNALLVGLFHEVATPEDLAVMLGQLPEDARAGVPAMRAEAEAVLRVLRGTAR